MAAAGARALAKPLGDDVATAKVLIFSKSYCPYCVKVKDMFKAQGVAFKAVELDQVANGSDIQAKLATATGQRTVPNVIIGDKHVGGCDDTLAAQKKGQLAALLA